MKNENKLSLLLLSFSKGIYIDVHCIIVDIFVTRHS